MPESFVADVIADFRVTLPKPTREILGIEIGDKVRVTVEKVEGKKK